MSYILFNPIPRKMYIYRTNFVFGQLIQSPTSRLNRVHQSLGSIVKVKIHIFLKNTSAILFKVWKMCIYILTYTNFLNIKTLIGTLFLEITNH